MQKRILAIHDISCYGRCSLTAALPIISAVGCECTVLPTAVLSTHTGGFNGYTFTDLTSEMLKIAEHWKKENITFDGIYTGYLGSVEQLDIVSHIIDMYKTPETKVIIDPVMGDFGRLYTLFDREFASGMAKLCSKADIIMPNLTEASYMTGVEYRETPFDKEYTEKVLDSLLSLGTPGVILTGVAYDSETLGALIKQNGKTHSCFTERVEGVYHGTGDVFGSAFCGAYVSGLSAEVSLDIAVKYTSRAIKLKYEEKTDVRSGVPFELCTEYLLSLIKKHSTR